MLQDVMTPRYVMNEEPCAAQALGLIVSVGLLVGFVSLLTCALLNLTREIVFTRSLFLR